MTAGNFAGKTGLSTNPIMITFDPPERLDLCIGSGFTLAVKRRIFYLTAPLEIHFHRVGGSCSTPQILYQRLRMSNDDVSPKRT